MAKKTLKEQIEELKAKQGAAAETEAEEPKKKEKAKKEAK